MFQTKIEIPISDSKITYKNHILTLGSCFAENIGKKMADVYFDVDINPFGVLYNPVSILNSINYLLNKQPFSENDLFQHRDLWQSFAHSSLFSATSPEKSLENINSRFLKSSEFFNKTDFLLITFGTAWVYVENSSGSVVSNCHKLPANHFDRRRLTVDEIVADYSKLINELTGKIPHLKIIFTVSPIRHWKDGAHENNLSKSILLLAIEKLQSQFESVQYFPAYEIMMDELRDYRFYASDMLHPSDVAVDFIWQRFSETYLDEITMKMKKEFEQLHANLHHRPLFPDSEEFHTFEKNIMKQKNILKSHYPFISDRLDK